RPYTATPTQSAGWTPPSRNAIPGRVTDTTATIRPTSRPGWATESVSAAAAGPAGGGGAAGAGEGVRRGAGGGGPSDPRRASAEVRGVGFRGSPLRFAPQVVGNTYRSITVEPIPLPPGR